VVRRGGDTEEVRTSFVVAADGAAGAVRKVLGVSFDGVTRDDERFVIVDVRTADLDREYWHNWSDPNGPATRVSICPLPGTDVFQFVAPLPAADDTPALTPATVQRLFDQRSGGVRARSTDAPWITLDRANERLAGRFRPEHDRRSGRETRHLPTARQLPRAVAHRRVRQVAVAVEAGDRVPDTPLQLSGLGPSRLFQLMRETGLTCVAFGDLAASAAATTTRRWGPGLRILDVRRESPGTAGTVRARYGIAPDDQVAFLVRPDGFVGSRRTATSRNGSATTAPRLAART
jgi:hypothetical protein